MYNHDDDVMIFTAPNRYIRTVDKCDMNPHYVICSVDKMSLLLYYCDYDGGGSSLLHNWVAFPKMIKEKNKKRALIEAKNQKDFKTIFKGK